MHADVEGIVPAVGARAVTVDFIIDDGLSESGGYRASWPRCHR